MDPLAAKYIGAGLACLGMAGAAIGLGNLFGQFYAGALRNPSAADGQRGDHVLLAPPYIATSGDIDMIVERLGAAVDSALKDVGH